MKPYQVILKIVGFIALSLGLAGLFLPILPTTPFLILALWCFARSSPKMHAWIINHPKLGPVIKLWQEKRAIPISAKLMASLIILLSLTSLWLWAPYQEVKIGVTILLSIVTIFILTRPSY